MVEKRNTERRTHSKIINNACTSLVVQIIGAHPFRRREFCDYFRPPVRTTWLADLYPFRDLHKYMHATSWRGDHFLLLKCLMHTSHSFSSQLSRGSGHAVPHMRRVAPPGQHPYPSFTLVVSCAFLPTPDSEQHAVPIAHFGEESDDLMVGIALPVSNNASNKPKSI
jgi:hypothetical protein